MSFYQDRILPKLINWTMKDKSLRPLRENLLEGAYGRVLELGAGAGANFLYYPSQVAELVAIEPHAVLADKAREAARSLGCQFQLREVSAEKLPFESNSFDCVVSTFTLCSVNDTSAVLGEVKRVLKVGGKLLLLEHGLSPDAGPQFLQRRLNRIQKCLAGGCQLTKDHFSDLKLAGLHCHGAANFYLPHTPRFLGYLYKTHAVRSS